ncbi:MAG: hypothetical protein EU548_00980 [Promethearchaeota archaeon]|nr:MAG: hypothetical protein EU548_00980 [Candidatus Lokiarchaeota archaeon]
MSVGFKYVFYVEVIINLLVAIIALFFPDFLINMLFGETVEFYRFTISLAYWYAVLLIVISYIMLRSLISSNLKLMIYVLEGYLIGDILQLIVIFIRIPFGLIINIGIIFTVSFTIVLIISRIIVILKPDILGFTT